MTMTITIHDVDEAEFQEVLRAATAAAGANEVTSYDSTPMACSAGPSIHDPNAFRFEDIAHRAERLFIAFMEREQLSSETEISKIEALACFWLSANFQTVKEALAHSYADDAFPVGKSFDDFVESFLGEGRYEQLLRA
jgi:hypothetical protein